MRKKRAITLLEIMIVILLIGLIGGVVSYNLKGTLDKGKAFASDEGAKKLEDIINLELQQQAAITAKDIAEDKSNNRNVVKGLVLSSGLISSKQAEKFLKDGWGEFYTITQAGDQVKVKSEKHKEYKRQQKAKASNAKSAKG
jgi:type II secretory pathway pseudopilin PulG